MLVLATIVVGIIAQAGAMVAAMARGQPRRVDRRPEPLSQHRQHRRRRRRRSLTLANYYKIKDDATYDEVKRVLGVHEKRSHQ